MRHRWSTRMAALALLLAVSGTAGATDWFTRVRLDGVEAAARHDIALYEKGQLPASLHVGDCYFHVKRWREGVDVFRRLRDRPDRNYAAAATVREAEGLVRLGRRAGARSLFEECLERFPEAFLDVDIPELCRVWIKELGDVAAGPRKKRAPPASPGDETGDETVREEIRKLEREIAELRERIAALKRRLTGGD
jgi:tetratricopeptide (TPR) repeat protein